jgi:hypothetical protein
MVQEKITGKAGFQEEGGNVKGIMKDVLAMIFVIPYIVLKVCSFGIFDDEIRKKDMESDGNESTLD